MVEPIAAWCSTSATKVFSRIFLKFCILALTDGRTLVFPASTVLRFHLFRAKQSPHYSVVAKCDRNQAERFSYADRRRAPAGAASTGLGLRIGDRLRPDANPLCHARSHRPQTVVTPAPATYPGYVAKHGSGPPAAPAGPTMTPFGPAPATGAAPTLPPGGYAAPAAAARPPTDAPVATLNGNVQPPPANWDPFAPPGTAAGSRASCARSLLQHAAAVPAARPVHAAAHAGNALPLPARRVDGL